MVFVCVGVSDFLRFMNFFFSVLVVCFSSVIIGI